MDNKYDNVVELQQSCICFCSVSKAFGQIVHFTLKIHIVIDIFTIDCKNEIILVVFTSEWCNTQTESEIDHLADLIKKSTCFGPITLQTI